MVGGQTVAQSHRQIECLVVVHGFEGSFHAHQYTITDEECPFLSDKLLDRSVPFERVCRTNETKGGPVIRVLVMQVSACQKRALRCPQSLYLAFSLQERVVEELHQFAGCLIFYWPQTHHQRLRSRRQEGPAQSQLFIASRAHREACFTAAQRHQFTASQVHIEHIDRVEL